MFAKLQTLKEKYEKLGNEIVKPEIIANQELWRKLVKEHSSLEEIVRRYEEYNEVVKQLAELDTINEPDMIELIEAERASLSDRQQEILEDLKLMLIPSDPNDEKNVIMEIRAGTGGDEAALFGADLLRMYTRYAERKRYKIEFLSTNFTELGGVKEVIFSVAGRGAYSKLKFESGVHRVQRVPETESGGRIHTSAATVAVLPEAEDVEVEIKPDELRVDVFRSGGHGGQSVNTTDSAVRITHLPTGLVVTCQDEKSQLKNKEKAMRVLKTRLLDLYRSEAEREIADSRRSQVGSGDRSERIRTYNFPQNRITDHRINLTLYNLEEFLDGAVDEMIEALILEDRTKKLAGIQGE